MNAIETNEFTQTLVSLSEKVPRPRAILCVSAHWMTEGTWVTAIPLKELFEETYFNSPIGTNKLIPNDEEIPPLLNRIYPCHEIVKIDGFLPGCPPRADLLWDALNLLIEGKSLDELSGKNFRYD